MADGFNDKRPYVRRNSYPLGFLTETFTESKLNTEERNKAHSDRGIDAQTSIEMNPLICDDDDNDDRNANNNREDDTKPTQEESTLEIEDEESLLGIDLWNEEPNSPLLPDCEASGQFWGSHTKINTLVKIQNKNSPKKDKFKSVKLKSFTASKGKASSLRSRMHDSVTAWKRKSAPHTVNLTKEDKTMVLNQDKTKNSKSEKSNTKKISLTLDNEVLESDRKKSYSEDEVLDTLTPLPVVIKTPQIFKRTYKRSISEPLMNIGAMFTSGKNTLKGP